MAEISVTINGSSGSAPTWGAVSFDHAALVAAGRSRADGLDFYARHITAGPVALKARSGLNTATATVDFLAVTNGVDAGYRIGFGDLGYQTSRVVSGAYSYAGSVTTASVPALTLPAPAHALTKVVRYARADAAYPDALAPRRRDWNENPTNYYRAEWRDITPEEWYEIRAWFRARYGGATGATLSDWTTAGTYRPLPGSFSATQDAGSYFASMELEELVA